MNISETYNNIIIEVKSFAIIHFKNLFDILLDVPVVLAEALHLRTPDHQLHPSSPKLVFADCTWRIDVVEHVVLLLKPTVMILLGLL